MSYEPWTDADRDRLRTAVADDMRLPDIIAMFPSRTPAGIRTKIRYERHRKYILGQRSRFGDVAVDATDLMDARLSNMEQDQRFRDAMRAALDAGLEHLPKTPMADYAEFRPAPFYPSPRVSYGGSPAALCAELGAR